MLMNVAEKFNFKVLYRKGIKLIVADALSRSPIEDKEGEEHSKIIEEVLKTYN